MSSTHVANVTPRYDIQSPRTVTLSNHKESSPSAQSFSGLIKEVADSFHAKPTPLTEEQIQAELAAITEPELRKIMESHLRGLQESAA